MIFILSRDKSSCGRFAAIFVVSKKHACHLKNKAFVVLFLMLMLLSLLIVLLLVVVAVVAVAVGRLFFCFWCHPFC